MSKVKIALIIGLVCIVAAAMVIMPGCKTTTTAETTAAATTAAAVTTAAVTTAAATTAAAGPIKVGISIGVIGSPFCEGLRDGSKLKTEELGATPVVVIADGDATLQATQIEDLVAQGCQVVLCFAVDTDAITASAKYCKDKGVLFVEFSRISPDLSNVDLAMGFDNKQQAEICGQAILDGAKDVGYTELKCIEFVGSLTDQNAIERQKYFDEFAAANGIKVVASVLTDWDGEVAYSRFKDAITSVSGDYNCIYSASDFLYTTIMSVLTENGQWVKKGEKGYKIITGIDGAPDALEKIRTGYVYMVANTDVLLLGRETATKAIDMVTNGTKYEGDNKVIIIPAQTITAANCDDPAIWGNNY
jgi:ABC-type sugar transport system substrate-binding protein